MRISAAAESNTRFAEKKKKDIVLYPQQRRQGKYRTILKMVKRNRDYFMAVCNVKENKPILEVWKQI